MMFYMTSTILALSAFTSVNAFLSPSLSSKALLIKGWKRDEPLSSTNNYLSSLGGADDVKTNYYSLGQAAPTKILDTPGNSKLANGNDFKSAGQIDIAKEQQFWDNSSQLLVQGGSLKTWSFASPSVESVQLRLWTEGRPLDASVDLWQGPDNTPQRIRVYLEDGNKRPFSCLMLTPRGPNTVAIRNMGQMEFPFTASVNADVGEEVGPMAIPEKQNYNTKPLTIQGGALRTYPFDVNVESVQVLLKTDGRPLNARIELLQGPNNNKQVIEVYAEDGLDRPFYVVLETPGSGNVVRIVNVATVEFPMTALVEPYLIVEGRKSSQAVLGGDSGRGGNVDFWVR